MYLNTKQVIQWMHTYKHTHTHTHTHSLTHSHTRTHTLTHTHTHTRTRTQVIQWMQSPEEAFAFVLRQNNKWELDGRGPNGFAGVSWV
jgi:carbohydrate-binding DOMON domain-containing protein